ncbi:MAG TPA: HAMP domain-containing sensor histidine kinase [Gemmatimonadaceae bacterium]|nr:HAMP domain-containing sensor histidine kinase [Gemmatimonadaceae bacterium]
MATEASSSRLGIQRRLVRLRLRLTIWYVATFGLIILLLGGGLFVVVSHQLSQQLDDSLKSATVELMRAARIREMEKAGARGRVIDAVDELNIPDRILYLMDLQGNPVKPTTVPAWVRNAAIRAVKLGPTTVEHDTPDDKTLRLHARRFQLASGKQLVAVAVADRVELEDKYADLITAFAGVAFAALVLVAAGGFLLVRKSTEPIERSILFMRRFMADAAHELRTPITVLRTRAEVALQQPREAANYVSALRGVEAEAHRLGGIVDSLLVLARADAGERPLERQRLFLDDLAIDAAGAARVVAKQKGVEVTVDEFEEAAVVGDAGLIRQLIMILLDNAIKFTDAGGVVRVRVSMHKGAPTFVVEDTGIGIKSEDLSRVFQRFFRGETARSRTDGAGLGLSIASWIAREHGADISLSSEPGTGTRAVVTFPYIPSVVSS